MSTNTHDAQQAKRDLEARGFRTPLSEKIFLDRYALKAPERDAFKVGDTVVFSPETKGGYPRREIGRVVAIDNDNQRARVVLRDDPESGERDIAFEHIDTPLELDYPQLCQRVARAIASVEPSSDQAREAEASFAALLSSKDFVPGGRILAGAGAPGDLTYYNCYVIPSPRDSRAGILETAHNQFEIMSRGGGVGINVSSLRPRYDYVTGVNGRSSGAVSWADLYSIITGKVEQGGSRRGALMVILDVWHPDVLDFITAKHKIGFLDNANISVGLSDDFMAAVEADGDWDLIFPDRRDPDYDALWRGDINDWRERGKPVNLYRTLKAREIFNKICESAWRSAEPGVFFNERYNKEANSHYYTKIRCTNPCVTGDTRLATQHGLIRVDDLYTSGSELACTVDTRALGGGKGTEVRPAVPVFMTSPSARVWRIETRAGFEIKATEWHDLYTQRGKIKVRDLKVGDKLLIQSGKGQFGQEGSARLGYVMGLLAGDGNIVDKPARGHSVANICLWGEGKRRSAEVVRAVNGILIDELGKHRPVSAVAIAGRDELRISSVSLAKVLAGHGFTKETKLQVPEVVWRGTEACVSAYLRGLFEADGTVNPSSKKQSCSVRLASSHPALLKEVQQLLANFGILSRLHQRREAGMKELPDGKGGRQAYPTRAQFELIIDGESRDIFMREIGFPDDDVRAARYREWVADKKLYKSQSFMSRIVAIEEIEPQPVYDTTQEDQNTVIFNGIVSGQCGEQGLPAWGVCNLGALNLGNFIRPTADGKTFWNHLSDDDFDEGELARRIDFERLADVTRRAVHFLDCVIDKTPYVMPENERQQKSERRVGLGVMGMAELLVRAGLRYGSRGSVVLTEELFRIMRDAAYESSVDLARRKGPFPRFEAEPLLESGFSRRLPDKLREDIRRFGLRNVTLLTIAPTGTTGSMTGTSTGIEPYFMFRFEQRGHLGAHVVEEPIVQEYRAETGNQGALPPQFVVTEDLDPDDHTGIMATAQKYIDSSISKTCNLPADYTVEDVEKFYRELYKLGCKGGTVYRDGSRDEQCLVKIDDKKEEAPAPAAEVKPARPRPEVKPLPNTPRLGLTHSVLTHIGRVHVTLNLDVETDELFDVFIRLSKAGSDIDANIDAIGRLVSLLLRLDSRIPTVRRLQLAIDQMRGIASSQSVGFGPNRVRSVPDGIAICLQTLIDKLEHMKAMRDLARDLDNTHLAIEPLLSDPPVNGHDNGRGNGSQAVAKPAAPAAKPAPAPKPAAQATAETSASSRFILMCPSCGCASAVRADGCFKCVSCGYSEC